MRRNSFARIWHVPQEAKEERTISAFIVASEAGAPTVNDVQVASNGTQSISLFNTASTFHFYCTIHPGMNLTVVVQ